MTTVVRVLIVALVFAGIFGLGTVVTKRSAKVRAGLGSAVEAMTASGDTPVGSALYGRHRAQRNAAATMRADLLSLVALDSVLPRDSTYPMSFSETAKLFRAGAGTMGPFIALTPHGWWATIQSMYSGITCAVAVGPDTTIRDTPSGSPVCYGPDWN